MDLNSYLAVLAAEATALAAAADEAGLEAPVPTCPGWTVNDLVLHMGEVHRWATAVLTSRATKLSDVPGDSLGALPELAGTTDWLRLGQPVLCLRPSNVTARYRPGLLRFSINWHGDWLYGCMGVWVCGCMGVEQYHTRTPIQPHTGET